MKQSVPELKYYSKKLCDDVPIKDILSYYRPDITIRDRGNICCPVHKDKTPSAKINEQRNTLKCFGCGFCGDSIDLVQALNPGLTFREACDKIIQDFGLNKYNYTNLRDIERIKGNRGGFIDFFPLSSEDINVIGLYNDQKVEKTWNISAVEYYKWIYADDPIPKHIKLFNNDGSPINVSLSHAEAVDIGLIQPEKVRESGRPVDKVYFEHMPSLQALWKEDKAGTERMIMGKAYELLDMLYFKEAASKELLHDWNSKTPIYKKNAETYCKGYYNEGSEGMQTEQLRMACEYARAVTAKDTLSNCRDRIQKVEKVIDKLKEHQRERQNAERRCNKNR